MSYNVGGSKVAGRSCAQAYTQSQFPKKDPHWTQMMTKITSSLNGIGGMKEGGKKTYVHE
jgi:hypothetical protein